MSADRRCPPRRGVHKGGVHLQEVLAHTEDLHFEEFSLRKGVSLRTFPPGRGVYLQKESIKGRCLLIGGGYLDEVYA